MQQQLRICKNTNLYFEQSLVELSFNLKYSSIRNFHQYSRGVMSTTLMIHTTLCHRPKPTCFNLPDHQFSYGRPGNQDSEGAREAGTDWVSRTFSMAPPGFYLGYGRSVSREVSMRWVGHTRSKRMQALLSIAMILRKLWQYVASSVVRDVHRAQRFSCEFTRLRSQTLCPWTGARLDCV